MINDDHDTNTEKLFVYILYCIIGIYIFSPTVRHITVYNVSSLVVNQITLEKKTTKVHWPSIHGPSIDTILINYHAMTFIIADDDTA